MLNIPKGKRGPTISVISNRVPTADEVVIVPPKLLRTATIISQRLTPVIQEMWAVGGDAGELMMGVNVSADNLEVITTAKGCDQICDELAEYVTIKPALAEKKLARDADVDGKLFPILAKSHYAELVVDGVKVEVFGDEQLKVGEWEWGDPIFFTPDFTYVSGGQIPLVPLSLKSELDLGLGWLDRVSLISDAVMQKHHEHLGG